MDPSQPLDLTLHDEASTLTLGRALAGALAGVDSRAALLLRGGLGSGKTTLVRGLALALPGGEEAEVASPSFNIVNIYPTRPTVRHVDLYRIPGGDPCVEEHLEAGAERDDLVIVEWAEYLPVLAVPPDRLEIEWLPAEAGRRCRLTAAGPRGRAALAALAGLLPGRQM
ncbi:MAG: tRNA (adenosine(37)-N6)-threonylcarbamoyltransferase complex ATPase subunit type 1 TsaE [Solidesulfovibrio sp. DCME]|uniref:tRNA (adenosine(37)-N6)-threonylcarbamoyltransferase complex ATPase subunit type 1 TsaE n=1 Tax=Solidesulfovibrio sp. DCME TaxID=3447380 RepID=UPI003D1360D3